MGISCVFCVAVDFSRDLFLCTGFINRTNEPYNVIWSERYGYVLFLIFEVYFFWFFLFV